MSADRVVGVVLLVFAGGCASMKAPTAWERRAPETCQARAAYTPAAVSRIVALRESGASRKETARRVGGTPTDVRCLEWTMRHRGVPGAVAAR